jgi:hypothetical protein
MLRHVQPGRPNPKVAIWSIDLQKDESAQTGSHFSKGLIPIPEEFRQKLVAKLNFCGITGAYGMETAFFLNTHITYSSLCLIEL